MSRKGTPCGAKLPQLLWDLKERQQAALVREERAMSRKIEHCEFTIRHGQQLVEKLDELVDAVNELRALVTMAAPRPSGHQCDKLQEQYLTIRPYDDGAGGYIWPMLRYGMPVAGQLTEEVEDVTGCPCCDWTVPL